MCTSAALSDFEKAERILKSRQEQTSQGHLGRKAMAVLENSVLLFTQVEGKCATRVEEGECVSADRDKTAAPTGNGLKMRIVRQMYFCHALRELPRNI